MLPDDGGGVMEGTGEGRDAGSALEHGYGELVEELDRSVQQIKEAAFRLKAAAGNIQAVERNTDRILASARMLEINVSDMTGRPRTLASWTEDDALL